MQGLKTTDLLKRSCALEGIHTGILSSFPYFLRCKKKGVNMATRAQRSITLMLPKRDRQRHSMLML